MNKLCIVADVPNWAFDNIAQLVKKDLGKKYEIDIAYFNRNTEKENFFEFYESIKENDLIHFLNRRILLCFDTESFKEKARISGYNYENYILEAQKKITTGVYDYINLEKGIFEEQRPIFNKFSKDYYTSTSKLYEIYNSIENLKKPFGFIPDICDGEIFKPINLDRFENDNIKNRKIIIGWIGNSIHTGEKNVDLKGFRTIIRPVVEELKKEGYNIDGFYADRKIRWRVTEEMPEYYSQIDICVCASIHEGTPRPILEAMYSGIPIISTDVGIVRDVLGNMQKEYIIGNRENGKNDKEIKKALREKILYLYNNRENFKKLSEENMKSIIEFDGGKTIKKFEDFFDKNLKN